MSKPLKISIRLLLVPLIIIGGFFFASLNGSYSKFESNPNTNESLATVSEIKDDREGLQQGDPTKNFLITYSYTIDNKKYFFKKEQGSHSVGSNSMYSLNKEIPIIYNALEPTQAEIKLSPFNKVLTDYKYYLTPPLAILFGSILFIDIFRIIFNKRELLSL